jgi:hypothetical protein
MMTRKPRNPPKTSKNMLTLELHNTRQGIREVVGADDDEARATRARVIRHMEQVEFAHEQ